MPPATITVLSVRQPFAAALLELDKIFECRSWATRYRGPLFIHASRWESRPPPHVLDSDPWLAPLWDDPTPLANITGHIIGRVTLIASAGRRDAEECWYKLIERSQRTLTPAQQEFLQHLPPPNDDPEELSGTDPWRWDSGTGLWVVREPQILVTPIGPVAGKLNLWKLTVPSDRIQFREVRQKKWSRRRRGGRLDDPAQNE